MTGLGAGFHTMIKSSASKLERKTDELQNRNKYCRIQSGTGSNHWLVVGTLYNLNTTCVKV